MMAYLILRPLHTTQSELLPVTASRIQKRLKFGKTKISIICEFGADAWWIQ